VKRTATVETADLEAAINYLEGLDVILRTLHEEQRGREGDDQLILKLSELEEAIGEWQPVNYQGASGLGWEYVAENLDDLRHRLVEAYGNAAL